MGAVRIDLPPIVGGGYGEFWRCRERYRVVKGGKASKKSATAALWFIDVYKRQEDGGDRYRPSLRTALVGGYRACHQYDLDTSI